MVLFFCCDRVRHSSYSSDKLDRVEPNNDITESESPSWSNSNSPAIAKGNMHCEIVIPALHTAEKPTLAKSKSDTSVNQLHCE